MLSHNRQAQPSGRTVAQSAASATRRPAATIGRLSNDHPPARSHSRSASNGAIGRSAATLSQCEQRSFAGAQPRTPAPIIRRRAVTIATPATITPRRAATARGSAVTSRSGATVRGSAVTGRSAATARGSAAHMAGREPQRPDQWSPAGRQPQSRDQRLRSGAAVHRPRSGTRRVGLGPGGGGGRGGFGGGGGGSGGQRR